MTTDVVIEIPVREHRAPLLREKGGRLDLALAHDDQRASALALAWLLLLRAKAVTRAQMVA